MNFVHCRIPLVYPCLFSTWISGGLIDCNFFVMGVSTYNNCISALSKPLNDFYQWKRIFDHELAFVSKAASFVNWTIWQNILHRVFNCLYKQQWYKIMVTFGAFNFYCIEYIYCGFWWWILSWLPYYPVHILGGFVTVFIKYCMKIYSLFLLLELTVIILYWWYFKQITLQ